MSRIWESTDGTASPHDWPMRADVVDIRDDGNDVRVVSIRSDEGHVVLTLAMGAATELEVKLTRAAARRIGAALDSGSRANQRTRD